MEIRKGNSLSRRWISLFVALTLGCGIFIGNSVNVYANSEALRKTGMQDFGVERLNDFTDSSEQWNVSNKHSETANDIYRYTDLDLQRIQALQSQNGVDNLYAFIQSNERGFSNDFSSDSNSLHETGEISISQKQIVLSQNHAMSYAVLPESVEVVSDSATYKEVEARDGEVIYLHVNENLTLYATSSNAQYKESEILGLGEEELSVLNRENTTENKILLDPSRTGKVSVGHVFEKEDGSQFQTHNDIIVFSNLIFNFNDGSATEYHEERGLYPSVNVDGTDAKTDEIVIRDVDGLSRRGYTFLGWNTEPDGSGVSFLTGDLLKAGSFTKDIRLYAIWAVNENTVRFFDASDADGEYAGRELFTTLVLTGGTALAPEAPNNKQGYVFDGWDKKLENISGNTAVHATYRPIQYSIRYEKGAEDAVGEMRPSTHTYDRSSSLSSLGFTRNGFTFVGWQMEKDGHMLHFAPEVSVINLAQTEGEEVVLHAVWLKEDEAAQSPLHPKSADRLRVIKLITGNDMDDGTEFTFRLSAISSSSVLALPMPNSANGMQVYDFSITGGMSKELDEIVFSVPGIYHYRIKEVKTGDTSYEYDTSDVDILYTVIQRGDSLQTIRYILKDGIQISNATFVNRYIGEELEEKAKKNFIENGTGEYKYQDNLEMIKRFMENRKESSSDEYDLAKNATVSQQDVEETSVQGNSETTVGTTNTSIAEEELLSDPTQDNMEESVQTDVTQNEATKYVEATSVPSSTKGSKKYAEVSDYIGTKVYLNGETPQTDQRFVFRLLALSEGAPLPNETTISRVGSGNVEFGEIRFKSPGMYKYQVKQDDLSSEGYVFDDAMYEITYLVSAFKGELSFVRTITKNGMYSSNVQFGNEYRLPRIQIRFDTDGASETMEAKEIIAGSYLSAPIPPKKAGYVFKGWTLRGEAIDFSAPFMKSETLVAAWVEKKHRVEFRDALDADKGFSDRTIQTIYVGNGESIEPPISPNNKRGYHFVKWDRSIRNITSELIIHAIYSPNTYKVYFDANSFGVNGVTLSQSLTYDVEDILHLNGFTKVNDRFLGWSTKIDGEVEFRDGEAIKNLTSQNNGVVILYAVWESGSRRVAASDVDMKLQSDVEFASMDLSQGEYNLQSDVVFSETETILASFPRVSVNDILIRDSDALVLSSFSTTRDETVTRYHIGENGKGVLTTDGVETTIEPKEFTRSGRISDYFASVSKTENAIEEVSGEAKIQEIIDTNSIAKAKTDSNGVPKTSDEFSWSYMLCIGAGLILLYVYFCRRETEEQNN